MYYALTWHLPITVYGQCKWCAKYTFYLILAVQSSDLKLFDPGLHDLHTNTCCLLILEFSQLRNDLVQPGSYVLQVRCQLFLVSAVALLLSDCLSLEELPALNHSCRGQDKEA